MSKMELLQGTLDMLVLQVLSGGPMHGWGIAQRIQILSKDVLQVEEGSIYPALYRMAHNGWIKAEWSKSPNNALYYASLDGRENRPLFHSQSNAIYASGYLLFARGDQLMAQPFDPANGTLRPEQCAVGT